MWSKRALRREYSTVETSLDSGHRPRGRDADICGVAGSGDGPVGLVDFAVPGATVVTTRAHHVEHRSRAALGHGPFLPPGAVSDDQVNRANIRMGSVDGVGTRRPVSRSEH